MSFLCEVRLGDTFGPFAAFEKNLGFIPNLLRAQTLLPRAIEAHAKLENAVRTREQAISRVQKERILLSVAAVRQDTYCVAMESKILSSLGVSDGEIDDLLDDYSHVGLSARDLASLQFCLKLSRSALSVDARDIESLRACGFEDESILEAVVLTAVAIYRGTLSVGLGPDLDFGSRKFALTRFNQQHG